MPNILTVVMALAAILFVALSATMNALFLSSLGRTSIEITLLGLVSIASDLAKAVLPVVAVRAVVLRAWSQVIAAALMLALVVVLSLGSGIGFAALTRGQSIAVQTAAAEALAAAKSELAEVEARLQHLPSSRPASVVDADLATAMIDRRWTGSKACAEISGVVLRQFCTSILTLRAERTASVERDGLAGERAGLRSKIERLSAPGNTQIDPQSALVAQLLGVDGETPRRALTAFTAVVIEFGSVLLILIVTGPTLLGWRQPAHGEPVAPTPATLPPSRDVAHWHHRREAGSLQTRRGADHA